MKRIFLFLPLMACADIPDLHGTVSPATETAPYIDFLTIDQMQALAGAPAVEPEDPLAARLARLRARADVLRGPVFSGSDRARLSAPAG